MSATGWCYQSSSRFRGQQSCTVCKGTASHWSLSGQKFTTSTCHIAVSPLQEARQPRLVQQIAGVIAGGAVHAEADIDAII